MASGTDEKFGIFLGAEKAIDLFEILETFFRISDIEEIVMLPHYHDGFWCPANEKIRLVKAICQNTGRALLGVRRQFILHVRQV